MTWTALLSIHFTTSIAVDVTADAAGDRNLSSSLRVTCPYYMQEKMAFLFDLPKLPQYNTYHSREDWGLGRGMRSSCGWRQGCSLQAPIAVKKLKQTWEEWRGRQQRRPALSMPRIDHVKSYNAHTIYGGVESTCSCTTDLLAELILIGGRNTGTISD